MGIIVPNAVELVILQRILQDVTLRLKLYSNNYSPTETSAISNFVETTGGGYTDKVILPGEWIMSPGDPTTGRQKQKVFTFTGPTTLPIYGYYVVTDVGAYVWAEDMPLVLRPISTIQGSTIAIAPRFEVS